MSAVRQAVVMVGGRGTRLFPLTENRPKPLLPVLGVPCVEYVIRRLAEGGVEELIMACGYRSEDMLQTIGDGDRFGISIEYSFEEVPAGTAGSVKLLEERLDDRFMVASGDLLADVDMAATAAAHKGGAIATMALTTVENPSEFGIVGLDSEGRIERFLEKPAPEEAFSNLINAGIYVLDRRALESVPSGRPYDFARDLFPDLLSRGEVLRGHALDGYWKDIGRPADLLQANLHMAALLGEASGHPSAEGVDSVSALLPGSLVEGSRVESSVVGADCRVTDAHLQRSLLLPGVALSAGSEVIDSIIGANCQIGARARVRGCVLADGTRVGEGEELNPDSPGVKGIF